MTHDMDLYSKRAGLCAVLHIEDCEVRERFRYFDFKKLRWNRTKNTAWSQSKNSNELIFTGI